MQLLALTIMWGSAFMLTKIAVAELAPGLVVAGRLFLACLLLVPLAVLLVRRPPRGARIWVFFVLIAVFGNALPFLLIAWGQRAIDSGLAGILMAIMPLATLGLAHYFVPGERLTPARILGFLLGFAGVTVLMGPEAFLELTQGDGQVLPMLAVVAGAVCYAVSATLARLRPPSDPLSSAAATTFVAALLLLPIVFTAKDLSVMSAAGTEALVAVTLLGVFSTAVAAVIYFRLVTSAGPTFVSQLNYLIPLWAVFMGVVFLGESPETSHLYALGLILGGILVTQLDQRRARRRRRELGETRVSTV